MRSQDVFATLHTVVREIEPGLNLQCARETNRWSKMLPKHLFSHRDRTLEDKGVSRSTARSGVAGVGFKVTPALQSYSVHWSRHRSSLARTFRAIVGSGNSKPSWSSVGPSESVGWNIYRNQGQQSTLHEAAEREYEVNLNINHDITVSVILIM
jgi:hypothetical protein